jgi:SAM-dependent methyltransferase
MIYRELLLGCGYRRKRFIDPYRFYSPREHELQPATLAPDAERWQNVIAVDLNPSCDPDLVIDLSRTIWTIDPPAVLRPSAGIVLEEIDGGDLQLMANTFDEVHAYEVLEHLGRSGDYETYFAQFDEIWRVLKPGGFFCATVPSRFSIWAWGDPGHSRIINPASLIFLSRPHYQHAVGSGPSSDYRSVFSGDFDLVAQHDNEEIFSFVLQAVKPARNVAE